MSKVTVGFKCNPELKQELVFESVQSGLTLSEFVESLCANRNSQTMGGRTDHEELENLRAQISQQQDLVQLYEAELLGPLFRKYQGKTMEIRDTDGDVEKVVIQSPADLLEVILAAIED